MDKAMDHLGNSPQKLCLLCGKAIEETRGPRSRYCIGCAKERENSIRKRAAEQRKALGLLNQKLCVDCGGGIGPTKRKTTIRCDMCAAKLRHSEIAEKYRNNKSSDKYCRKCGNKIEAIRGERAQYCLQCITQNRKEQTKKAREKKEAALLLDNKPLPKKRAYSDNPRKRRKTDRYCPLCHEPIGKSVLYDRYCAVCRDIKPRLAREKKKKEKDAQLGLRPSICKSCGEEIEPERGRNSLYCFKCAIIRRTEADARLWQKRKLEGKAAKTAEDRGTSL